MKFDINKLKSSTDNKNELGCPNYGSEECDSQCYECVNEVMKIVMKAPDNFDIFEDRIKSILERWKKYKENNTQVDRISSKCIKGFMMEINDDFTDILIEDDNLLK